MIRFTQSTYTVSEDGTVNVCAELFNILTAPPLPDITVDVNFANNTAGTYVDTHSSRCYSGLQVGPGTRAA